MYTQGCIIVRDGSTEPLTQCQVAVYYGSVSDHGYFVNLPHFEYLTITRQEKIEPLSAYQLKSVKIIFYLTISGIQWPASFLSVSIKITTSARELLARRTVQFAAAIHLKRIAVVSVCDAFCNGNFFSWALVIVRPTNYDFIGWSRCRNSFKTAVMKRVSRDNEIRYVHNIQCNCIVHVYTNNCVRDCDCFVYTCCNILRSKIAYKNL